VPTRRERLTEFFGSRTLCFLEPGKPAELTLRLPDPATRGTTCLRLGLLGAEPGDRLSCRFNGVSLPIRPTALQDVPLSPELLRESNRLVVEAAAREPPNPRLALGFASLRRTVPPEPRGR
jgi:hypothetical protein